MKISQKINRNTNLWIFLFLIAAVMIFITGCPGNSGDDRDEDDSTGETEITDDHPGDNSDLNNSSQPEVDDSIEDVVEAGSNGSNSESEDEEAVEDDDNTSGGGPVTGFQPTEDQPFCPPGRKTLWESMTPRMAICRLRSACQGRATKQGLQDDITVPGR